MRIIDTIADTDFVMFLLGAFGVSFYVQVHKAIVKCNPKVFSAICVVITYLVFTWIMSNQG